MKTSWRKCLDKKLLREYLEEVLSPPEAQPTEMKTSLFISCYFFWFSVSKTFCFLYIFAVCAVGSMKCSQFQIRMFLLTQHTRRQYSCTKISRRWLLSYLNPFHLCELLWRRNVENYTHLCAVENLNFHCNLSPSKWNANMCRKADDAFGGFFFVCVRDACFLNVIRAMLSSDEI